jgi:hypothetical protein
VPGLEIERVLAGIQILGDLPRSLRFDVETGWAVVRLADPLPTRLGWSLTGLGEFVQSGRACGVVGLAVIA